MVCLGVGYFVAAATYLGGVFLSLSPAVCLVPCFFCQSTYPPLAWRNLASSPLCLFPAVYIQARFFSFTSRCCSFLICAVVSSFLLVHAVASSFFVFGLPAEIYFFCLFPLVDTPPRVRRRYIYGGSRGKLSFFLLYRRHCNVAGREDRPPGQTRGGYDPCFGRDRDLCSQQGEIVQ